MNLDIQQARRFAPVGVAVVILLAGWMLVVAPVVTRSSRAARDVASARQQLTQLRASVNGPAPQVVREDPARTFERHVVAGDASATLLEQLASLASRARATNLLIETADQVVVRPPGTGPQTGNNVQPDPRLALFNAQLAYSPVSMAFDCDFTELGELMWQMRDFATTVEIRNVEIKPTAGEVSKVHATLTLFAYARSRPARGAGAMQ